MTDLQLFYYLVWSVPKDTKDTRTRNCEGCSRFWRVAHAIVIPGLKSSLWFPIPERQERAGKDSVPQFGMRRLGRRAAASGLQQANALLRLVLRLRSGRPFIPKGVHRFRSFEEAQQWSIQMQAGKTSLDHPR